MNPFRFVSTILSYLKQQPSGVTVSPVHTGANMLLLLAYLIWNNTKDKRKLRFRQRSEIYCTCSNATITPTVSSNPIKIARSMERTPSPSALELCREESSLRLALPAPQTEHISRSYYYELEEEDGDGPRMVQCQMVRFIDPPRGNFMEAFRQDAIKDGDEPIVNKKGNKKNKRLQKAYKGARRNRRKHK